MRIFFPLCSLALCLCSDFSIFDENIEGDFEIRDLESSIESLSLNHETAREENAVLPIISVSKRAKKHKKLLFEKNNRLKMRQMALENSGVFSVSSFERIISSVKSSKEVNPIEFIRELVPLIKPGAIPSFSRLSDFIIESLAFPNFQALNPGVKFTKLDYVCWAMVFDYTLCIINSHQVKFPPFYLQCLVQLLYSSKVSCVEYISSVLPKEDLWIVHLMTSPLFLSNYQLDQEVVSVLNDFYLTPKIDDQELIVASISMIQELQAFEFSSLIFNSDIGVIFPLKDPSFIIFLFENTYSKLASFLLNQYSMESVAQLFNTFEPFLLQELTFDLKSTLRFLAISISAIKSQEIKVRRSFELIMVDFSQGKNRDIRRVYRLISDNREAILDLINLIYNEDESIVDAFTSAEIY